MKGIILFIALLIVSVSSAILHERDIYNACVKKGDSGYAMWTNKISCNPLEIDNDQGER